MRRFFWLSASYVLATTLPLLLPVARNFEYEYALLVGLGVILLLPVCALITPAEDVPFKNNRYQPFITLEIIWIFLISIGFLYAPGVVAFYFTSLCACSDTGYFFWVTVQALPSWIIGHGLYHQILKLRCQHVAKSKIVVTFLCCIIALTIHLVSMIWFYPQVRITHLLTGFLHGPVYDSWLPLDSGIILTRVSHLLIGSFLLAMSWRRTEFKKTYLASVTAIAILWLASGLTATTFPSVQHGKKPLTMLLPSKIESEYFTIHYLEQGDDNRGEGKPMSRDIKRLYEEAQFHSGELTALLGKVPHTDIYLYPSSDEKKLWFGGGATDVTDVVSPSIHITVSGSPHPTLRHELVHAFASSHAFHGLGFHPNMAFTEGLAVALAPEKRSLSLHQGAAALIHSNRLPKLSRLFSPMFWQESGRRAYTVSGSIITYLVDTFGVKKVLKLYNGSSWEQSFGRKKSEILLSWRNHVLSQIPKDDLSLYAESLFRDPGVFGDRCPHSQSDLSRNRSESPYTRLRQPLNWDPDKHYLPWKRDLNPDNRSAQVRLLSKEAKSTVSPQSYDKKKVLQIISKIEKKRNWPPKSLEDIELIILHSDLLKQIQSEQSSITLLEAAHRFDQNEQSVGKSIRRQIEARLALERKLTADQALAWRRYLAQWDHTIPEKGTDEPWIAHYLRLRRGNANYRKPSTLGKLTALDVPQVFSTTFAIEWHRILAKRFVSAKNFKEAAEQFRVCANLDAANAAFFQQEARRAMSLAILRED